MKGESFKREELLVSLSFKKKTWLDEDEKYCFIHSVYSESHAKNNCHIEEISGIFQAKEFKTL
jgi:hypothetical protein